MGPLCAQPQSTTDAQGRVGICRSAVRAVGRLAGRSRRHDERTNPTILLINCSSRSEHTCPGEMSKSYRLLEIARDVFAAAPDVTVELLDLSRLASEYGRHIHPCKACFSTAAALCHWPCSCYPNYSLRSDARLDERDLSDVGRRARHHDHNACELVSGLIPAQADDGPPRLRRRRKPRPHPYAG